MASDFLSNYIFLAVGRVGSSTDLIAQRVEYVEESEKRTHLMHMLHDQIVNGTCGKVFTCFTLCHILKFSALFHRFLLIGVLKMVLFKRSLL